MNKALAFASIYHFEPSEDILDVDFNGYRILPIGIFKERYKEIVEVLIANNNWLVEPSIPAMECKYILVITGNKDVDISQLMFKEVCYMFVNTLSYARLFKLGDIQLGTIFAILPNQVPHRIPYHTDFNCFMSNIPYINYTHKAQVYSLNKDEMKDLLCLTGRVENGPIKHINALLDAIAFLNKAKNTSDISYKILNYVIFLERLLLGDNQELKFRLCIKLVLLLKDSTLRKFISDVYDMRSDIAHSGTVLGETFSKKYYENHKQELSVEKVYEYINRLDNIARTVANIILNKILADKNMNVHKVRENIDKEIFELLSK